jgi:predicted transcriptional regulator
MPMSLSQPTETEPAEQTNEHEMEAADLLGLLDAEYTRAILKALRAESKSARALAEECGASRPTVYRRLNSLQEAGLVESAMTYDADGHHRTIFEATVETLAVELTADGFSISVTTAEKAPTDPRSAGAVTPHRT